MDTDNVYIQNLKKEHFQHFGATNAELISYALDETGMLDDHTLIDGKSARELAQSFYRKRDDFRQNTRLGNILMSKDILTKEQLIEALTYHVTNDIPLGKALLQLGLCSKEQVEDALESQTRLRHRL